MEERYPVRATRSCAAAVPRRKGARAGNASRSAPIGLRSGGTTIHVPGHCAGLPAERLPAAPERFAPGRRLARDEHLDVTRVSARDAETVALSFAARSPVQVTVEVPRRDVEELPALLAEAQRLIETLRQGLGLVPDSLREAR